MGHVVKSCDRQAFPVTVIGKRFKADPTALWLLKQELATIETRLGAHVDLCRELRLAALRHRLPVSQAFWRANVALIRGKILMHHWIDRYLASKRPMPSPRTATA